MLYDQIGQEARRIEKFENRLMEYFIINQTSNFTFSHCLPELDNLLSLKLLLPLLSLHRYILN